MNADVRVSAAMLCDYAGVREGLLNVIGAGITRLWREQTPAALGAMLGVMMDFAPEACGIAHEVTVRVVGPGGETVGEATGAIEAERGPSFEANEHVLLPMALDLRNAVVTAFGKHRLVVRIDGVDVHDIAFWVQHPREMNATLQVPDTLPPDL